MAAPVPESRACACSTPRRRAGRLAYGLPSLALPPPAPMPRKLSRVTWCPCERGCAGPRGTGKPLQIAVDGMPGTTEATKPTGCDDHTAGQVTARTGLGVNEPKCNDMSSVG